MESLLRAVLPGWPARARRDPRALEPLAYAAREVGGAGRARVKIAHGQPQVHWICDRDGALGINLEDMWVDFEHSVNELIESLRSDDVLRRSVLGRWRKQTVTVQPFYPAGTEAASASASVASSATVIGWESWKSESET